MLRGALSRTTVRVVPSLPLGGFTAHGSEATVTALPSGKQNGHPDFQRVTTNTQNATSG